MWALFIHRLIYLGGKLYDSHTAGGPVFITNNVRLDTR